MFGGVGFLQPSPDRLFESFNVGDVETDGSAADPERGQLPGGDQAAKGSVRNTEVGSSVRDINGFTLSKDVGAGYDRWPMGG